jgi:hypothetical protein
MKKRGYFGKNMEDELSLFCHKEVTFGAQKLKDRKKKSVPKSTLNSEKKELIFCEQRKI